MASSRHGPLEADVMTTTIDQGSGKPQQPLDDETPPLNLLLPAIFLPLKDDLLQPITPAKDPVERLQRTLASLDTNETRVRDNINWMYGREAHRHVMEAMKRGGLSESVERNCLGWDEAEKHLANMAAPATPSVNYHLPPEKIAEFKQYDRASCSMPLPPGLSPHERTAREVLNLANCAVRDMDEFSRLHMRVIRNRVKHSMEKEVARSQENRKEEERKNEFPAGAGPEQVL